MNKTNTKLRKELTLLWEAGELKPLLNYVDSVLASERKEVLKEAYKRVGSWFRFPYRKGMKPIKVKGLGIFKGGGCEVCGGKLIFIRGRHPGDKKRKVCPTCATEILESLHSNLVALLSKIANLTSCFLMFL